MSTADTEGTSLEELLLTVLQSGTPLAEGLRTELTRLMHWLTDASESESAGAMPATELLNALSRLRILGNSPGPDQAPGGGNGDGPGDSTEVDVDTADSAATASLADTGGLAAEVTDAGAPATGDASDAAAAPTSGSGDDPLEDGEDAAQAARPSPAEAAARQLRELWRNLDKDLVAGRYCQVYGDPPESDTAAAVDWFWTSLLLTCLRLPGGQADRVRELAQAAVADYPDREQLPLLLPGDQPGEADPELGQLRELAGGLGRWPGLAGDVLWMAWLAWHDGGAKCAYHPTIAQGIADFDEDIRLGFTVNMRNKLLSLCADAGPEPGQEADQLVLVDEALRGIVPVPLPQPGSWWAARLEESERRLRQAEYAGKIRVLAIGLNSPTEWDNNFDKAEVVAIKPDEAAGDYAATFNRVWILRYPVQDPRTQKWKKGRYVAVK